MDELVESVLDYIRKPYTDHAVMINGEWGSGKTYFWNNLVIAQPRCLFNGAFSNGGKCHIIALRT